LARSVNPIFAAKLRQKKMRRPGDNSPEPSGGRAAERLRMFQQARGGDAPAPAPRKKSLGTPAKKDSIAKKQLTPNPKMAPDENKNRRTD
jgi:hypothetical protein